MSVPVVVLGGLIPGGQSQALVVAGDTIVAIGGFQAVWWTGPEPGIAGSIELPGVPVEGARATPDGAAVWIGPGRLDLATARFTSVLESDSGRIRMVAWAPDGGHAAVLVEPPRDRQGQRAPPVVEVRAGGVVRARIDALEAVSVAVTADRVVVGGPGVRVWNLDGAPVGEVLALGRVARLRWVGGEEVVAIGFDGRAHLVDARTGAIAATWDQADLQDVAVGGDRWVGVDRAGTVHVGCRQGTVVRTVSAVDGGGEVVAVDGDRLATAGAQGVRRGTLSGRCG